MSEFAIVTLAVFVVFAVLGGVYFLKSRSDDRSAVYTCSLCGEKDCICHSGDHA